MLGLILALLGPVVGDGPLRRDVARFNAMENETVVNEVPNAAAADWLAPRVPDFACPDPAIEEMYYFRWWALRKQLKRMPDGQEVFTEFITKPPVSSAVGHHVMEGRWWRDDTLAAKDLNYWLRGDGVPKAHTYSSWIAWAVEQRYRVDLDQDYAAGLVDALVSDDEQWVKEKRRPDGQFWQYDVRDAMEESISGGRHVQNVRPTIDSYQFGNAAAIARLAKLAGRKELAERYAREAEVRRANALKLWNPQDGFFEVAEEPSGDFAGVREELGFIPWYFELPPAGHGYEVAWNQAVDPAGFKAPFGLTTAERRSPKFRTHGVGNCEWDGSVWPFATSQTLTGWANVLRDYPGAPVTKAEYFEAFQTYVKAQHRKGIPYIGEYLDETTGVWLKHDNERSRWYNHSTFADVLITGVIGLRPRADNVLEISPLLPDGAWPWFAIEGVRYHGHDLTILWDQDGSHFGKGAGLQAFADGRLVGAGPTLAPIRGPLPP